MQLCTIVLLFFVSSLLEHVESEKIEVYASDQRVYSSVLAQSIKVRGYGFSNGINFHFEPSYTLNEDYTMNFTDSKTITLSLLPGKKWKVPSPAFRTYVTVKSILWEGKNYIQGGSDGIRIATIVEDPKIEPSTREYRASQSKIIGLWGSDFSMRKDLRVTLMPTFPSAYYVRNDDSPSYNAAELQLHPGQSWLPKITKIKADEKIPLQVYSIDTGAGEYVLPHPIIIAYIIKDVEGYTCDDSCRYAFNYRCEDHYAKNFRPEDLKRCSAGTDCTDCGGIDAVVPIRIPTIPVGYCVNSCQYRQNGVCDDTRGTKMCDLGTDCADCGPVTATFIPQPAEAIEVSSPGINQASTHKDVGYYPAVQSLQNWIIGLVASQLLLVLIIVCAFCKSKKPKEIVVKVLNKTKRGQSQSIV